MGPITVALAAALSILAIVGSCRLLKRARDLQCAVNSWAQQIDPSCDSPTTSPAVCAPLLSGALGRPPPSIRRPSSGPPPYDAPTATYAVKLAARFIAYLASNDTRLVTLEDMMPPVLSFQPQDQKMALAGTWASLDGYSAVVAIRGTKTEEDFRLDMKYHEVRPSTRQVAVVRPPTPLLGSAKAMQVHSGMYGAYVSVRDSLFAALPTALTSRGTGEVFMTGHSMGAAVAFYFALELAVAYPNIAVTAVGLAPPRAGDGAFAEEVSAIANCTSIINLADFVPSMPWSYMPDSVPPYTVDEYAHVMPVFAFNNRKADVTACHGPLAYFEGITNSDPPVYIPSVTLR